MKIIFLDIDDVLCTMKAHKGGEHRRPHPAWPYRCAIDRDGVKLLNEAADKSGAVFVCCSTWRQHLSSQAVGAHLAHFGWRGNWHADWATPINGAVRGREIADWLAAHPEVDAYAIVDDNPTAGVGHDPIRFVHIADQYQGMTAAHLPALLAALQ